MLPLALFLGFLVVPVLEIYVIIQVGQIIGGWPTVGLLLAESLLGAWIVRREGRRAWRALTETFRGGRLPDRELSDAALVLVGGTLLLTPGFVTDAVGFLFVLPFTRPVVRRLLAAYVGRRVRISRRRMSQMYPPAGPDGAHGPPYPGAGAGGDSGGTGPVIRGQVVRDDAESAQP
ncbi:MAG TPA: FxsA family protein [Streptosporangiaceae bacterium]|nr:FxsA family protein [Streptosporangiaceae bacterium]